MVYVDFGGTGIVGDALESELRQRGILSRPAYDRVRLVLHHGIDSADVDFVIDSIRDVIRSRSGAAIPTTA
jgi:hypothetical protein